MLRRSDARGVGRDRVRLLQAVAREGSITAGAKAVGLTYKAAWDALEAMSNLFGRPLLETRTGGRRGGGAHLTPAGVQVVEAFERLESEMARVLRVIEPDLDVGHLSQNGADLRIPWTLPYAHEVQRLIQVTQSLRRIAA